MDMSQGAGELLFMCVGISAGFTRETKRRMTLDAKWRMSVVLGMPVVAASGLKIWRSHRGVTCTRMATSAGESFEGAVLVVSLAQ